MKVPLITIYKSILKFNRAKYALLKVIKGRIIMIY